MATPSKRAYLFMVWGEAYIEELNQCLERSTLPDYPIHVITDRETSVEGLRVEATVHRLDFELEWKTRKAEMARCFPDEDITFLFLDVDTCVLHDISLGFDMAERHGIAMAQAACYTMEHFKRFGRIMALEGVEPRGQLLYNSGVIFFRLTPAVREVFDLFHALARKYPDGAWGDQTYLSLAMEMLGFNPYTLSHSFNHRGFGDIVTGHVRVWHSRYPVPEGVNDFKGSGPRKFDGERMIRHRPPHFDPRLPAHMKRQQGGDQGPSKA